MTISDLSDSASSKMLHLSSGIGCHLLSSFSGWEKKRVLTVLALYSAVVNEGDCKYWKTPRLLSLKGLFQSLVFSLNNASVNIPKRICQLALLLFLL